MGNTSLIHADVFFFISTIALVLLTIGASILLFYLIGIIRNVKDVTDKIKAEGGEIITDLKRLRLSLKEEGVKWKVIANLIRSFFMAKANKAGKATKKTDKVNR